MNEPYFQSKGKNKNLLYGQGKRYYRRYVVEGWDDKGCEERRTGEEREDESGVGVKASEMVNGEQEIGVS